MFAKTAACGYVADRVEANGGDTTRVVDRCLGRKAWMVTDSDSTVRGKQPHGSN